MDKVSARPSKVKRLTENVKQQNVSPRSLPHMSETALKRWCEARDTYLGDRPPHVPSPRRVKQKTKIQSIPIMSQIHEHRSSKTDFQPVPIDPEPEQTLVVLETIDDPIDTKCVGTETEDSILCHTEIEQIDEAIQADLPSSPDDDPTMAEKEDQEEPVEYDDKATETDLIVETKNEDEIDYPTLNEIVLPISNEITIEPIPDERNSIEPLENDDTKSILSSQKSERSLQRQVRRYRCIESVVL